MSARKSRAPILLASLLVVGCTDARDYAQATAVLVDVSATYVDQKPDVVRFIKMGILPDLLPGDSLLLIGIDDLSYEKSIERLLSQPTINLQGLVGGYTGPGGKSILPSRAEAKLEIRMVPNQTYEDTVNALIQGASRAEILADGTVHMHGGLRIGIHVHNAAGGQSDSFINALPVSAVPEPSTAALALVGVVGLGLARRRRQRREAASAATPPAEAVTAP